MLAAITAVLVDLFYFVFPIKTRVRKVHEPLTPHRNDAGFVVSPPPSLQGVSGVMSGTRGYVVVTELDCFARPVIAFDGKVATLPYGTEIVIGQHSGMFVYVEHDGIEGWVDSRGVTFDKNDVVARLVAGEVYPHGHSETKKIRRLLHDECSGGLLFLPLQPVEFILYELRVRKIGCPWSFKRPRTPGVWHSLLRGQRGVRVGVEPKTGAVMEYARSDGSGVLALVEAVHPDETIIIRSVGKDEEGLYAVEQLTRSQWRELRPVFIIFV